MDSGSIFTESINIIISLNDDYKDIVLLSLKVSISAVIISSLISLPLSYLIAVKEFYLRNILKIIINTLLALPPVVVGLILYIVFSVNGILGKLGLLYTVTAMIIAQFILITPIIIGLSINSFENYHRKYDQYLISIHASEFQKLTTLIFESKYDLTMNILLSFSRALSEVGAIIIVGGNIAYLTRTMTTGIVLETSKGDLPTALSLGITLLSLALIINIFLSFLRNKNEKNN